MSRPPRSATGRSLLSAFLDNFDHLGDDGRSRGFNARRSPTSSIPGAMPTTPPPNEAAWSEVANRARDGGQGSPGGSPALSAEGPAFEESLRASAAWEAATQADLHIPGIPRGQLSDVSVIPEVLRRSVIAVSSASPALSVEKDKPLKEEGAGQLIEATAATQEILPEGGQTLTSASPGPDEPDSEAREAVKEKTGDNQPAREEAVEQSLPTLQSPAMQATVEDASDARSELPAVSPEALGVEANPSQRSSPSIPPPDPAQESRIWAAGMPKQVEQVEEEEEEVARQDDPTAPGAMPIEEQPEPAAPPSVTADDKAPDSSDNIAKPLQDESPPLVDEGAQPARSTESPDATAVAVDPNPSEDVKAPEDLKVTEDTAHVEKVDPTLPAPVESTSPLPEQPSLLDEVLAVPAEEAKQASPPRAPSMPAAAPELSSPPKGVTPVAAPLIIPSPPLAVLQPPTPIDAPEEPAVDPAPPVSAGLSPFVSRAISPAPVSILKQTSAFSSPENAGSALKALASTMAGGVAGVAGAALVNTALNSGSSYKGKGREDSTTDLTAPTNWPPDGTPSQTTHQPGYSLSSDESKAYARARRLAAQELARRGIAAAPSTGFTDHTTEVDSITLTPSIYTDDEDDEDGESGRTERMPAQAMSAQQQQEYARSAMTGMPMGGFGPQILNMLGAGALGAAAGLASGLAASHWPSHGPTPPPPPPQFGPYPPPPPPGASQGPGAHVPWGAMASEPMNWGASQHAPWQYGNPSQMDIPSMDPHVTGPGAVPPQTPNLSHAPPWPTDPWQASESWNQPGQPWQEAPSMPQTPLFDAQRPPSRASSRRQAPPSVYASPSPSQIGQAPAPDLQDWFYRMGGGILPPGWTPGYSPEHQSWYFVNSLTSPPTSTWIDPRLPPAPPPVPQAPPPPPPPPPMASPYAAFNPPHPVAPPTWVPLLPPGMDPHAAVRLFQAAEANKELRGGKGIVAAELDRERAALRSAQKVARSLSTLPNRFMKAMMSEDQRRIVELEEEGARAAGRRARLRDDDAARAAAIPIAMRAFEGPGRGWDLMKIAPPHVVRDDEAILGEPYGVAHNVQIGLKSSATWMRPQGMKGRKVLDFGNASALGPRPHLKAKGAPTPFALPEYTFAWDLALRATSSTEQLGRLRLGGDQPGASQVPYATIPLPPPAPGSSGASAPATWSSR